MKQIFKNFFFLTISLGMIFSCSSDDLKYDEETVEINFIPAKTNKEFDELTANKANNLIRSLEQYDLMVKKGILPISKLDKNIQDDFRTNLKFNKNGLAGLKYGVISEHINFKEFNSMMTKFGIDVKDGFWLGDPKKNNSKAYLIEDHAGYWCHRPNSCYEESKSICTSNC